MAQSATNFNQFSPRPYVAQHVSAEASVMTEGSSVEAYKGEPIRECESGIHNRKDVFDLSLVPANLRYKLSTQILKAGNMDEEILSYGGMIFNEKESRMAIDFSSRNLVEPSFDVLPLSRGDWRMKVQMDLHQNSKPVKLLASTGLGKTLKIPPFISSLVNGLVYLVEPTPGAAYHIWNLLNEIGSDVPVVLDSEGGNATFADVHNGIIVGSAAAALRRLTMSTEDLDVKVFYMDEFHWDSATYAVLRCVVHTLKNSGVKLYAASATFSAEIQRNRVGESVARTCAVRVPRLSVVELIQGRNYHRSWDPRTVTSGKWLYILPNHKTLLKFYLRAGKDVGKFYMSHKLSAKTNHRSLMNFNASDGDSTPSLMFVTSEFGSMYNFDCDHVYDSGYIEELVIHPSMGTMRFVRTTTSDESLQREGRVARFSRAGTYYTWQDKSSTDDFYQGLKDTSVKEYYLSLLTSFYRFGTKRASIPRYSKERANVLLNAKFVSSVVSEFVNDEGKIHRFIKNARHLFWHSDSMSVDVSWEITVNHDVHVDFEKPSFAYHYHDKFPIRNVTEYNRLVCAVFDPTVPKPPISVPPLGTMNDVFEESVDRAQNTFNRGRRAEHMEAETPRSNIKDEIEHDKRGVCKSTQNVVMSSGFKIPEPTPTVYHDLNEASVDASTMDSCGATALQKIRDVSWRDRADDLQIVRYDEHATPEAPSLSTVVTSRGASFIEGGFSGIDLSYRVLNRYVLEALSHSMVLPENVCVPFMTLYGDAPGYRDIYSVKRCPSLDGRRLREMFMSSLDTFRCYSPLLSTSATENYWIADGKQESRVKTSIEDPLRFYSGPMDVSLKAFDDFVKVWNTLSQKMTVASVVIESNSEICEGKFFFPFNRKRRIYEQACKTFERCSVELALMSEFYAKFLRPKNLIMVPVKSISTAGRISRLSSWLDMIKQPLFPVCLSDEGVWKFDKMCDAYFGVNIFRISKTLRNGEVVRGFGFMSTYLFVPRHVVHALIDDRNTFGSVSLHDLPRFEAENIEGVRFNFHVVHEDVRGDMYICVPDRVSYDEYRGATSRECSRVESVKIVSVMTDSNDHFVKVFSTRGIAVYDGLSGRGIVSDCEVDLGMSGSLVVSCDSLEPLGLVQAMTEDRGDPSKKSLVFTSFGSKVRAWS